MHQLATIWNTIDVQCGVSHTDAWRADGEVVGHVEVNNYCALSLSIYLSISLSLSLSLSLSHPPVFAYTWEDTNAL